jgi:hypothetical protein
MYPYTRINASSGPRWRNRLSPILPWIFILGVVAGTMLPIRSWVHWPPAVVNQTSLPSEIDTRAIWARAANSGVRHPVDVVRTIDGDTFEALVHLWPGLDMTTRVRMRGIDAAEMKAACPEELRLAQAASARLHDCSVRVASPSTISVRTNITGASSLMLPRCGRQTSRRRCWRAVTPVSTTAGIVEAGAPARARNDG